jgi:hypothetical protein
MALRKPTSGWSHEAANRHISEYHYVEPELSAGRRERATCEVVDPIDLAATRGTPRWVLHGNGDASMRRWARPPSRGVGVSSRGNNPQRNDAVDQSSSLVLKRCSDLARANGRDYP